MSTAKSKRQSTTEYSPESAKGRSKKRRLSSDDHDEDDDKVANLSKLSKDTRINGMRTPAFTHQNKPAELFRKDLISAMKLADSEQLQTDDYLLIQDPWRQDWEKGVQVPVNSVESLHPKVRVVGEKPKTGDFKIPRKFLHAVQDESYKQGQHELTGMQQLSEQVVRYDLDDLDACWLKMVNEEREEMGEIAIYEWTMERVMEELERQCHETMETTIQTEEGLGIEYDEDVICDVCRSPESEENNEMVFCDGCDICVHQACYGIQKIPEGSWLCRTCALGIKPTCMLCPKTGGAMKSTRSGTKWSHVSCALWIPEVSIGCVEKMEPITKISQIPISRWALVCCLCKERAGACIQCSVKTCKIAFHVTCGISHNLDMKTILDDSGQEDGVKLKAFCPKHTKRRDRTSSDSELDSPTKDNMGTPKKDLTNEEEEGLRKEKLKQLEDLFYTLIDVKKVAEVLQLPLEAVDTIVNFWKLKRKSLFDKPLLTPKTQEAELLEKQQEDSLMARMKMFVHLRQDLERVRNLCYMVSRREKMKRSYRRLRESVFMSQVKVLSQPNLSTREVNRVKKLYYDTSCYRPRLLQDSSDEAPSTSQECSTQPFSREGTPLSSSSLTSEPEIRKSSRRRILSCKLRDVSPVFSDSTSQDGSVCVSDEIYVPGYDSDIKTKTAVKRSLPVNGKLSLSRQSRMSRKIFGSDSENTETEPPSPDSVSMKEPENEVVKIDVDVSDKSEIVTPVKRLPFKHTPSSPSPNTRLSLRSDHSNSSPPKTETPLERTKLKVENSNNPLSLVRKDSPKRRVRSRFSRTPLSAHNNVRKTRQTPSISPESVENKPADFNNRLKDVTPSPVKHKHFGEQLTPLSCSPVYDIVKKDLKDVLQQSQLVIDEKLREEVEERLLKSASPKRYMNGVHGRSPRRFSTAFDAKITRSNEGLVKRPNSFNQSLTPNKLSNSDKVLNEISPTYTRTGVENKDWFGTNTSPKGSLSGYKIPKKSNRTPVQSPVETRDQTNRMSPLPTGVLETRGNVRRKVDLDLNKVTGHDGRIRRSADSTPDKIDRRLTRSHGHENIEDVLITGKSRVLDSLQMWSSNMG